jgi:hypothetical protein
MNTGGQLPYQLRPNKAVERLMFIELLGRLDLDLGIGRSYSYVGFGGPQMEDFRVLHERFPVMKMLSLEKEQYVLSRQRFNQPHTNVRCRLQKSGDFIAQLSGNEKLVAWLDYTDPEERSIQISEFQSLLRNLRTLSIIKLTLNAAPATLGGNPGESGLQALRRAAFLKDFERCFPSGLEEEKMENDNFPSTLLSVVDYTAAEALRDRVDWRFQPLTSATYADGQQMLTVTGILGRRTEIANVLHSCDLATWEFARLTWSDPVQIQVPELTLKERIFINQLLPKLTDNVALIQKRLRFLVDSPESASERKLQNYVSFQKHYPFWGKVAI